MPKTHDNFTIVNVADGSSISGHEAVEAHFKREQALEEEHGASLTFQLYRADLHATTLKGLQGEKLAELKLDGAALSGTDTVAQVKEKVLARLVGALPGAAHATFMFSGRPMSEDRLFFADHFMLLPSWVQVVLHDVELADVLTAIQRLRSGP